MHCYWSSCHVVFANICIITVCWSSACLSLAYSYWLTQLYLCPSALGPSLPWLMCSTRDLSCLYWSCTELSCSPHSHRRVGHSFPDHLYTAWTRPVLSVSLPSTFAAQSSALYPLSMSNISLQTRPQIRKQPHGFEQASLRLLDRLSCDALKRGLHQHRHHS